MNKSSHPSERPVKPRLSPGLLLMLASWTAFADPSTEPYGVIVLTEQTQQSDSRELEPVVVTGTRTEHRLSDSPVPVMVINAQDIARSGAVNLAELLQREGGVHVAQAAGRGSTIEIQGLSSEHVLILVNGRRVNGRINGAVDLSRLRVASIERVEIVRGPSSALYGSDALGGVVNVIMRSDASSSGRIRLQGRDDGGAHLDAHEAWSGQEWSAQMAGGLDHRAAFDLDTQTAGEDGPNSDLGYFSANIVRDFANQSWLQDVALDFSSSLEDSNRDDAGTGGSVLQTRKRIEEQRVGVSPHLRVAGGDLALEAFYHRYHDQYFQTSQTGEVRADEETLDQLYGAGVQWTQMFEAHLVTAGIEHQLETLAADRLQHDAERDRQSIYLQDEWDLLGGQLTLVPGLRYDRDSQFDDQVSPKFAARYDISPQWMLRASYGHGYRAPDFKQLLLRFDNGAVGYRVEGNPDLKPERSRGFNMSSTWLANAWSSAHLSAFYHRVEDLIELIQTDDQASDVYSYRNVRSAILYGADIQFAWRLGAQGSSPPWQLKLGYGWLHSRDQASGQSLSGRPEHRANAAVYYDRPLWAAGLRGTWVGEREFLVDTSSGGQPTEAGTAADYSLFDLRGEYKYWAKPYGIHIAAGLKNLFDAGDSRYLPIAPRSLYLEISKDI